MDRGQRWGLVLCAVAYFAMRHRKSEALPAEASAAAQCAALRGFSGRIVVIGDVHGDVQALKDVLSRANVADGCDWNAAPAILVQLGDVVDRGPDSNGANACLRELQASASLHESRVVRLVGNHELMWAEGNYRYAHKTAEPRSVIAKAVAEWRDEIERGDVLGAFAVGPFLFTHSGFRPQMLSTIEPDPIESAAEGGAFAAADALAAYVCKALLYAVRGGKAGRFQGAVFSAGPDRGGSGVGGPFWTDFKVLEAASAAALPEGVMQVVGHTAARCEAWRPGSASCEPIRHRADLKAIVADAGLSVAYASNRAFVEIVDHKILAHTRGYQGVWRTKEISAVCDAAV
ncbi:Metallo-dependent phosphatase-like protein [Pelagophyceae sp. CCMP2097]|nr:Metallo-dependent phosphatase-like protein [Pelagophyceae sp. CCMP2097]|mmetsp:Transcript_9856/g.32503  ORF Transcript_9856/g.32503 Transcript_9856/m.32503 type:complete len:346 (-) Transcript_9856:98-1135(-)